MQHDVAKARAHAGAALDEKQAALARAKAAAKGGNSLADMFKDPDMLKAMRPSQVATMKLMYGSFVKQLNLSPEQADKFYGLLVDNGIKSFEAMQSGNVSPQERNASQEALNADLQSLLGDAGFKQYSDYMKNDMQDQTLFTQIKNDFTDCPLSDAQQNQILQAMNRAGGPRNPLDLRSYSQCSTALPSRPR